MKSANSTNLPWYPSVDPFEHYDSGRTHRYQGAIFGGSLKPDEQNQVRVRKAECAIPTPFNVAVRGDDELFVCAGGYGDVDRPLGPLVAKLNGDDLSVRWWSQLNLTRGTNQWDYPGTVAVHRNRHVYTIYGNHLSKLDAETGEPLRTTTLPALSSPEDTACNGFTALTDGTIVSKNLSRRRGCKEQGFSAFTKCRDPQDIPDTMLVTLDPDSLEIIDCSQGPEPASGRISATRYKEADYAYLVGFENIYRYRADCGKLYMDKSWGPVPAAIPNVQTPATAIAVINDYVVFNTNASPITAPMSVWACSQADSNEKFEIRPFDDKDGQESFYTAMVSVDPENNRIYAMNTGTGQLAAISLNPGSRKLLSLDWTVEQYSFSFMSLVGPEEDRVIVASDIPAFHEPGTSYKTNYETEQVVWREAKTLRELARSERLPAMSKGAALSPGAKGAIYYPGAGGQVIKLSVEAR